MASKKSKNTGIVVSMLIISVVGGALIGAYVMSTPEAQHVSGSMRKDPVKDDVGKTTPVSSGNKFVAKPDGTFESQKVDIPAGVDAHVFLVNEFLNDLHARGLGNKDAKALGVDVHGGVAYIDFNSAFDQSFGTDDEGTVLNGILTTMGQFPDVQQVQFEINGKNMETTGNVDLSTPQNVLHPSHIVSPSPMATSKP